MALWAEKPDEWKYTLGRNRGEGGGGEWLIGYGVFNSGELDWEQQDEGMLGWVVVFFWSSRFLCLASLLLVGKS
jgi:hypothetical protein